MDDPDDTHRHLSHLIGLYPGYAIASYNASLQSTSSNASYTREKVLDAARTSLAHRGDGAGPDANAGWEKMWRAAAWAQLGDAERFYHQLTVSGRGGVVDEAVADSRSHFRLHLHLSLVVRHCHELRS